MVDGIIFDMDGVLLDTEAYGAQLTIRWRPSSAIG